ncbi:hypothetical protein CERSUDRAFT_79298 [Gelatoporia subvermispora B]|uniref:Thioesterase/thiol ester dehydrase-isomerase n=1 Tax=Ceriporiopsis subvermispora (strain B) TaxID=914234 RepID=M2PXN5_CERS8|nr:hypothetical protein CERSUDRAFT_79298 [Gelatoporia subvermispora B]
MVELENKQVEHELISTSLEVEKLEANLFRSKSLWIPIRARGVFGGQVISQALVSATECVDPAYALHSMHCYFLLSASPAIPIVYHVDRVRDGRSYVTRAVRAVQNGRTVFIAMCSFQRPEPRQPSYQTPMPAVQGPEQCDDVEVYYEKILMSPVEVDSRIKEYALEYVQERKKSPIAIKTAGIISEDGMKTHMYWFKARNVPKFDSPAKEAAYQKCILSYISDSHFLVVARRTLGLDSFAKGAQRLAMLTTLDHTIWFYDDSFDCGDWLLYVISTPRAGGGRGVVHGRMYTRTGTLVAVTSQEGVIRAHLLDPSGTTERSKL